MSWFREWLTDGGPDRASDERPGRDDVRRPDRRSPTAPGTRPDGRPRPRGVDVAAPGTDAEGWPGRSFGLPESGPGSVASPLRRGGQFLLDLLIGGLVASAIVLPAPNSLSLAVWAALVTLPVAVIGQTPAMVLTGLRVARVDGARFVGAWALARTVSLFFVVPALFMDRDARGLQDRVSRTVVLRTR